jgi:hypothetical protein
MVFLGGGGNLPEMLSGLWRMGTYREHCSLIAVRNLSRMFLDIKWHFFNVNGKCLVVLSCVVRATKNTKVIYSVENIHAIVCGCNH